MQNLKNSIANRFNMTAHCAAIFLEMLVANINDATGIDDIVRHIKHTSAMKLNPMRMS